MRNRLDEHSINLTAHCSGRSASGQRADAVGTPPLGVQQLVEQLQPSLERTRKRVENIIRHRPLVALIGGAIVGVTLGCMIKRR